MFKFCEFNPGFTKVSRKPLTVFWGAKLSFTVVFLMSRLAASLKPFCPSLTPPLGKVLRMPSECYTASQRQGAYLPFLLTRHKLSYNSFHCLPVVLAAGRWLKEQPHGPPAQQAWLWTDIASMGWLLGEELHITLQPDEHTRQKSCSWLKTNIEHGKKMSKDKHIKCDMSEGFPQYKSHMWEAWA